MVNENVQRQSELRSKQSEIEAIKAETARTEKLRDALLRKIASIEEQKRDVDSERERLKAEAIATEAEVEVQRRERESEKKTIDDLVRKYSHSSFMQSR